MDFTGEQQIKAPRETVYRALNDPEILKLAIPGCRSLEKRSDSEMDAEVGLKMGPVRANFKGGVTLSDLDPPNGYVISGKGSGGPAGLAKGNARVRLEEAGDGTTRLLYTARVDMSGRIAQLGGRLIQSTADRLSAEFFESFKSAVEAGEAPAEAVPPTPEEGAEREEAAPRSRRWLWWAFAAAVIVALLLLSALDS